ncbi:SH3 domain-containing protein [Nonomuraea sp. GTA35]|uniref:SH3 domain-containing protein n=1 Tax=Nonomuraea sp. GTA35 TaxID=1676746 RepID=UPI0035BEC321
MRTTITKLAIAGAAGVTGLLGAAATAQADAGTGPVRTQDDVGTGQVRTQDDAGAGQVRTQAVQPMADDDDGLRVADPEGAPVRAGPGPAYEVVDRMDYGEPVQYDETTGYVEMTEEEAAQIAELTAGDDMPGDSAAYDVYRGLTGDDMAASAPVPAQAASGYPAAYVVQQVADAIGPSTSESAWLNVDNGYVWLGDVEPG